GVAKRTGGMADGNLGALVAQALDVGAVGSVGALHGIAEIDEHLGDAAHADAADADEMDRTDIARQFHALVPRLCPGLGAPGCNPRGVVPPPTPNPATRWAARMAPCERAAAAIATSFCGALASAVISPASRSGEKSSWRRRIAPPARSSTPALAD